MHGTRRVITFCLLTTVLPTMLIVLPLYLRNIRYADVMYKISDSDVIQIHKGQSSVFCEKHSLRMNTSFNAFQMRGIPELSDKRKHIRLKKSMTLPDDTLEYWGFYLLKGATVKLKACSRFEGSKILVVKDDRILNTCGILEGLKYKKDPSLVENQGTLSVTVLNPGEKKENKTNMKSNVREKNRFILSKETNVKNNVSVKSQEEGANEIISKEKSTDRVKRDTKTTPLHNPNTVLDTGVHHGGNAYNTTSKPEDESVSSFEVNLYDCYQDKILMTEFFPYSIQCNNTNYLEDTTILKVVHEVLVDGYYYYIFYSDNDIVVNDIHAIFDIYKPTFQYVNNSESKVCLNKTECVFDIGFLTDESVIVEVPTKDGLQNDDVTSVLISVCNPRVSVYIIFPIAVLLLILLFAFL
ncbi:uncharacterized protein LOC115449705 isoform X2 [Manduca sexta]|nr:uncharacterized protein LOC115449705 isoform X2 [Manduca sexta]XP_030033440.1 uncharacterized protein LOC115449705 isoform X2 [Manduca sexta]